MNAQHAKEFAACTKAETIALHKKAAAAFRQHPEDDRRLSHLGAATLAPRTPGERHGLSTPESAFKLRKG